MAHESGRVWRSRAFWPDPIDGPYVADIYWSQVDRHLECVGLRLSSLDDSLGDEHLRPARDRYEPVSPSLLRRVPWRRIMDDYRRDARTYGALLGMTQPERDVVAARLRAGGVDPETASYAQWLQATPLEVQERALDRQPARPEAGARARRARGGRPPRWTEEQWLRRAAIYQNAVRNGEHPNEVLAEVEGVELTTARTWAAILRRKGLLAATRPGVPSPAPPPREEQS